MGNGRRNRRNRAKSTPSNAMLHKEIRDLDKKVTQNTEVNSKVNVVGYQPTTSATFSLLNGVPIGTGADNRIGNQCNWLSYDFRGTVARNPTLLAVGALPLPPIRHRIIIFKWKSVEGNPGADPTLTQLLETNNIDAPYNTEQRSKFVVYMDKLVCYKYDAKRHDATDRYMIMPMCKTIRWKKTIKNCVSKYSGTGATVADMQTNLIYLMIVSDVATAADNPTYNLRQQIRWTDS